MSGHAFHIMTKPGGPICNLDCKYCFYLEKEALYPNDQKWAMHPDILESYIRQYINAQPTDVVYFAWQGGEPTLLGLDFFRKVVELQKKYANGKQIENSFQTNGVLLDDAWGGFFSENKFLVGISIDGPQRLHDAYRVDKGGIGSFHRTMAGMKTLKRNGVSYNTLTTVHRANSCHPLEVYRFLREQGSGHMQFIPIIERKTSQTTHDGLTLVLPTYAADAQVTEWSVGPEQYGRFLCIIFDEWIRRDVGKQFVQLFDVSLEMWSGQEASLCVFRRKCGQALAMEHNGDLYSCDHFVYPEDKLGNIMETQLTELVDAPQQKKFGEDKENTLPKYCQRCDVQFVCNGECPKHRFLTTPDGEPGLNYLCAGYKMFFHHVDPYMQFMAGQLRQGQAPANVMRWVAQQDAAGSADGKARRNGMCPCGSGKKYKVCCLLHGRQ
ncbi:MAG: anaerobic sulfatase-maturation protein [Acidobacteriaceae bacterium]